ncbi:MULTISPECIES: hypothetical protein [unclassified Streptomyces]|uniref:hypothetical protein n=1 Tax=unclassified Streptomyces TaxID=2593676 RepID=UPI0013A6EBD6|nr:MULTISPECIES: hypothetical protein [unclassified Streptomyces]QZZ28561.1 hypothetical protein A7X85_21805 [Streptomyces sp. ST1015]
MAVAQADVTGRLILHAQAAIAKKTRVRGVLPTPDDAPAVRIAVGGRRTVVGGFRAVYEIPLLRRGRCGFSPAVRWTTYSVLRWYDSPA